MELQMDTYKQKIEGKYKKISRIPEGLLNFTAAIRKNAIAQLNLSNGSSVMNVGCGTGASFPYLQSVVGESGRILGIEPSKSMISVASERVKNKGWKNIILRENTMEEIEEDERYDGALLFAMHDVFNSMEGIKKIYSLLQDGSRIVRVGPQDTNKRIHENT
jgi:ubiquinone/menaquinone biosynthesis C-methylase UbiE